MYNSFTFKTAIFVLLLFSISYPQVIYKDEGKIFGNYSNSTLSIIIFDSPTGGKIVERFYTKIGEDGSWRLEEETDKLRLDTLYWKEYIVKNDEVDWGVKERERKPIFITLNPLLKALGDWLWRLQLEVDAIQLRIEELEFIKVMPDRVKLDSPVSLQEGVTVNNIINEDQPVDGERTLVTKNYVDQKFRDIESKTRIIENTINNTNTIESFLDLVDTPSSYSGQGGKFLMVKNDESGITFKTVNTGGGSPIPPHNQLSGLQGGNSSDRYHLTGEEHNALTANIPFDETAIVFISNGSLETNNTLSWKNGTVVINKTAYDGFYAVDVGGHMNAIPLCFRSGYLKDYLDKTGSFDYIFSGSIVREDYRTGEFFRLVDIDGDKEFETIEFTKDGYYLIDFNIVVLFELINTDFIGDFIMEKNGRIIKIVPLYFPKAHSMRAYSHYLDITDTLYFSAGDRFKMYFKYRGDPIYLRGGSSFEYTSFSICKVN